MAEGIDIRVTASGAAATQQALQGVAGAEQQVAAAARGTAAPVAAATAAQKDHGAAIDFNRGAYKEFRQALAFLGPEFAVVGEAVQAMTMRHGQAAVGLGLLSAALVGVSMVYGKMARVSAEFDAAEKASLDTLKEKRDIYVGIAEQVEKAISAEARMMGRTPTASAEALLAQAAEVGTRIPMGKAGVESMAKSMGARGRAMPAREADAFARWLAMGKGAGLKDEQLYEAFRGDLTGPGGADEFRGEMAGWQSRNAGLIGPRIADARGLAPGGAGAAETESIFERIAKAETGQGRARTSKQIRDYVDALVQGERSGAGGRTDFSAAMAEMMQSYGDIGLGRVGVTSWKPAGAVDPDYVRRRPILAGETGQTTVGQIFQGGSHVHLQGMQDPAGTPVEGTIGYTGR
jgi:hypothetical protein